MDWLVIDGARPWDGRYELDILSRPLTRREWHWIKRFTGYLPLTWWEGLKGGDADLYAAFAVIALHRAGRIQADEAESVFERFDDVDVIAAIRWELNEREDGDADRPPALRQSGSNGSSGPDTPTSLEISASTPPRDGTPDSATSESAAATLAT